MTYIVAFAVRYKGDLLIDTVRATQADAKSAAIRLKHWKADWNSMVAHGYELVEVSIEVRDRVKWNGQKRRMNIIWQPS